MAKSKLPATKLTLSTVEGGVVKYYRNSTLIYTSTVAPTYPLQVDTSLNTVNADVYNVVITSDLQNVTWTNVSSTIQVTGNSIQKVSGTSLWDAGAVSSQAIVAGDGYMEFTPGETATWRMCGLGNTDSSAYYTDIEYAFFIYGGGGLSIYESGIDRGSFGTYAAGDRLKVAVEGGVVKYYRNATLLYTSTVAPTYPLQVDTSLNTVNAGVYNVMITSDLQNATWTNVSPTIQVTGNSIQKVSGTYAWDAGAVSSQAIVAGDGYMEFTPGETGTYRMCGLGNTDSSAYFGDIDYAFFLFDGGGGLQIYESGNLRGTFGTYAASDRLKVAVEGGVVKYYRNATLLYTSTVAPTYPLQVDTSLNTVNAGVYNVVISGTRVTASPINYVLQDVQGSTRAVMSGTSVIARHDFLPFGEEIAAGTGLRTTGQGFGAVDKIRQRYGLTERDDTTGLDHTWWRKYENLSGRWTSPDPVAGTIANPQSFNRYSYIQNDPVNFVDPSGLLRVCFYSIRHVRVGDWGGHDQLVLEYCIDYPDPPVVPREPRDPPEPRGGRRKFQHPQKKQNQQKEFDDCIAKALRSSSMKPTLKAAAGVALTVGGSLVAINGIPTIGVIGLIPAFQSLGSGGSLLGGLDRAKAGGLAALAPALLGAHLMKQGSEEGRENVAAVQRRIKDCEAKYPNARHSPSYGCC